MSEPTPPTPPAPDGGGVDWNKILDEAAKDPGFKPVPADKYRVRIEKAEAVKAGTGSDMVKVQAKIVGGPHDGKMLFTNIVFAYASPKSMNFTMRKLKALGISEETLRATNPRPAQIAAMLLGVEAEADVTLSGKDAEYPDQNDIRSFRSLLPGGGTVPGPPTIPTPSAPAPSAADIPKPTIPEPPVVPEPEPEPEPAPAPPEPEPPAPEPTDSSEPKEPF